MIAKIILAVVVLVAVAIVAIGAYRNNKDKADKAIDKAEQVVDDIKKI